MTVMRARQNYQAVPAAATALNLPMCTTRRRGWRITPTWSTYLVRPDRIPHSRTRASVLSASRSMTWAIDSAACNCAIRVPYRERRRRRPRHLGEFSRNFVVTLEGNRPHRQGHRVEYYYASGSGACGRGERRSLPSEEPINFAWVWRTLFR